MMTIFTKRSIYARRRKTSAAARLIFTIFLTILVSPLAACAPPVSTAEASSVMASSESTPTATKKLAATSLTFTAEADAQVDEANPTTNRGSSTYLQVDGADDPAVESFIRFAVTEVTGTVQNARLRVYDTTNASENGPAVYGTEAGWIETSITWGSRPARISGELDNQGNIQSNTWAEYDVTSLVTGNGQFSFVLAADSNDAATFSSRQGAQPPELVITLGNGPTATADSSPTDMPTASASPTNTKTSGPATPSETLAAGEVVLVGAGDISICDNDNDELTAQLLDNIPGTVFTTGDNAYPDGTNSQYRNCYDPTWGRHKDRTKPVPGNHEYNTSNAAGYFQYFNDIPSYYAYDLGSWRIYALNSEIDVSLASEQVAWLLLDLAANPRECVLAYWHQPRWSSGSHHGSDEKYQALWQIFYEAGAELILNGHEHNYERFSAMNATGQADPLGLQEIVVGTGGRNHYDFDTPLITSEVRDDTSYGVLKLTLREGSYEWEFIPAEGSTFTDSGTAECH